MRNIFESITFETWVVFVVQPVPCSSSANRSPIVPFLPDRSQTDPLTKSDQTDCRLVHRLCFWWMTMLGPTVVTKTFTAAACSVCISMNLIRLWHDVKLPCVTCFSVPYHFHVTCLWPDFYAKQVTAVQDCTLTFLSEKPANTLA